MNKTNLYWQVYKNLEREFLALAEVIHIDDYQLENVYSMRIADLLLHAAVEVESISKHLYMENGGTKTDPSKMYFDTDCLAHLNSLWNLEAKVVLVVSPNLFLEKEENIILTPLKNAQYRQPNSAEWEKAYQAVKHDRENALKEHGRLIYLMHALAALYVLNLYNKDEKFINLSEKEKSTVELSFGSSLFSVKLHNPNGLRMLGNYEKRDDYDECVYIEDYESKSKQKAVEAIILMEDNLQRQSKPYLDNEIKLAEERGEVITEEWVQKKKIDFLVSGSFKPISDLNLRNLINDGLKNIHYNIVLNKQQY